MKVNSAQFAENLAVVFSQNFTCKVTSCKVRKNPVL